MHRPTTHRALAILGAVAIALGATAASAGATPIRWQYRGVVARSGINALDCPTAKLCVAAAYNSVAVSNDPAGPASSWKRFIIDRTRGPNGISSELTAVGCSTAGACVTGDDSQNGWFSARPFSAGWTPFAFPSDTFVTVEGIGCSPLGNCTALSVDGREMSSPTPTSGKWTFVSLPHTNPNATTGSSPAQISCPNRTCVIAWDKGGVWVTRNAGLSFSWVPIPHSTSVDQVSCPTANFCIAGQADAPGQHMWISRNPASSSAWHAVATRDAPRALACPSTTLCLEVVGHNTFSSTRPTQASSWKPDLGTPFRGTGFALSCPSTHLCVDADQFGGISVASF